MCVGYEYRTVLAPPQTHPSKKRTSVRDAPYGPRSLTREEKNSRALQRRADEEVDVNHALRRRAV